MPSSFIRILAALAVIGGCFATPVPETHVVHEKRYASAPDGWVKRSKIPSHATVPMRIGLTQNNLHLGSDYLTDVYVINYIEHCLQFTHKQQSSPTFCQLWETLDSGGDHQSLRPIRRDR